LIAAANPNPNWGRCAGEPVKNQRARNYPSAARERLAFDSPFVSSHANGPRINWLHEVHICPFRREVLVVAQRRATPEHVHLFQVVDYHDRMWNARIYRMHDD